MENALPEIMDAICGRKQRGIPLERIASLVSRKSASIFHLKNKGEIVVGADADLTLIDLETEREVQAGNLQSVSDYSLYEGRKLKGWPTAVILRGQVAMSDDEIKIKPGSGQFIQRH